MTYFPILKQFSRDVYGAVCLACCISPTRSDSIRFLALDQQDYRVGPAPLVNLLEHFLTVLGDY